VTLRLHDYLPLGNGYKVGLLLRELRIPFEWIEYDLVHRGDRFSRAALG
jgi:glutathione S-transferase